MVTVRAEDGERECKGSRLHQQWDCVQDEQGGAWRYWLYYYCMRIVPCSTQLLVHSYTAAIYLLYCNNQVAVEAYSTVLVL